MTRVAAVDCGTNSLRLLIADAPPDGGALRQLERRMEIVRLGQGVDRTGRIAPEALDRTLAVCRDYAELIREHQVTPDRTRFIATSASRDAENRAEFIEGVQRILGVTPEVISGDEEAQLSYLGATRSLAAAPTEAAEPAATSLVLDIGGGSTEFVLGRTGGEVTAARSVDIGCVRLTERHLLHGGVLTDPPAEAQLTAIRADIHAALDTAEAAVPLRGRPAPQLIGLAGSVTTVSALAQGLTSYDPAAIDQSRISRAQVADVSDWLLRASHAERAAQPPMHPGRVDVIGAGALILRMVMERMDAADVLVSERDILDGIALRVAGGAR